MQESKPQIEEMEELRIEAACHIFANKHEFSLCGVPRSEQEWHNGPFYTVPNDKYCPVCKLKRCERCVRSFAELV